MSSIFSEFRVDEGMRTALIRKVRECTEVFSFKDEPLLASLMACLGLQSEIGNGKTDRLSPALKVDVSSYNENPWKSQIISHNGSIGIRLWIEDVKEFYPDHHDFSLILHPTSVDHSNTLNQIIIFPELIAKNYAKRNLELVIVRDWALTSFLADKGEKINYFMTNDWEVKNNSARFQTDMMRKNQVAFMGTHDLVDHLLGGNGDLIAVNKKLLQELYSEYQIVFNSTHKFKNTDLVVSYLIGVVLDDMAQPKWYHSQAHTYVLKMALRLLSSLTCYDKDTVRINVPYSFNHIIELLRTENPVDQELLKHAFDKFTGELLTEMNSNPQV